MENNNSWVNNIPFGCTLHDKETLIKINDHFGEILDYLRKTGYLKEKMLDNTYENNIHVTQDKDFEEPVYLSDDLMRIGTSIYRLDLETDNWQLVEDLSKRKSGDVCFYCQGIIDAPLKIDSCYCFG